MLPKLTKLPSKKTRTKVPRPEEKPLPSPSGKTKRVKMTTTKEKSVPPALPSLDPSTENPVLKACSSGKKLYVPDTNVFMHDPAALVRFQEHDIYITRIVLEELNDHKGDQRQIGQSSRQALRYIDELLNQAGPDADIEEGIPISLLSAVIVSNTEGAIAPTGLMFIQTEDVERSRGFQKDSPDNEFLSVAQKLKNDGRNPIVVSKDRVVRIKAMSLKIPAEDYKNDQTIDDIKLLYSGMENLPENFWDTLTAVHSWKHEKYTFWDVTTPLAKEWRVNQFLFMDNTSEGEIREYIVLKVNGESAQIRTITDYRKHDVYGIFARNREQNFAINALLDPDIDFVSLAGKAGSGKTLLSLAAGLEQTIEWKSHNRIIFTREAVALGKEQGFLPGNEEAKLAPWLGALYDNLEILTERDEKTKGHSQTDDAMKKGKIGNPLLEQAISIKSLNYMQGRTLIRKIFIVDESQNITRDQAKQLITRAGPGTKVVFLGNLAQVATPYLSGTSSGLAYVVDRFKRYEYSAHITLAGTERSRLAAFAADNL